MEMVRGSVLSKNCNIMRFSRQYFSPFFRHLCADVVRAEHVRHDDTVFQVGDLCSIARCVDKGELSYFHEDDDEQYEKITKGRWVLRGRDLGGLEHFRDAEMR